MAATVFLDWFGTLADREEMPRRFRAVLAEVLQERSGGQIADALRAHDLTYEWYMTEWPRRLAAGGRLPQDLP